MISTDRRERARFGRVYPCEEVPSTKLVRTNFEVWTADVEAATLYRSLVPQLDEGQFVDATVKSDEPVSK